MENEALLIRGLSKDFGTFKLGPIDLTVPRGAIYGFIGPNASGKSTTLELIMGMGGKDHGSIHIFGMEHEAQEVETKKRIGFFSPDTQFNAWGRVNRVVSFFRGFYDTWDDAYCLGLLQRFNLRWDASIATLSFGERTKLGLILALSHRPPLLILDEPMSGLDAITRREVYTELLEVVQDEDRSVLISSHNLDEVERFADHVGILRGGKMLAEGPTQDLLERFQLFDAISQNGFHANSAPGVRLVQQNDTRIRVLLDTTRNDTATLTNFGLKELTRAPLSLEDLFLALVKRSGACPCNTQHPTRSTQHQPHTVTPAQAGAQADSTSISSLV